MHFISDREVLFDVLVGLAMSKNLATCMIPGIVGYRNINVRHLDIGPPWLRCTSIVQSSRDVVRPLFISCDVADVFTLFSHII